MLTAPPRRHERYPLKYKHALSEQLARHAAAGDTLPAALPPLPGIQGRALPQGMRVRSVFISDVHLGTRACQAERLLEFLRAYDSEFLFLVGDIVDFWGMSRGLCWSSAQNTVIQKILKRARRGDKVIYIPGNHDEVAREHAGTSFGNIRVLLDYEHVAADGKRYLLVHGDEFDQVTRHHRWLAVLGDRAYTLLVRANILLSWARRKLGLSGYWSLAGYAKRKVKKALNFIWDFEDSVARYARERNMHGVICGHIHAAVMRDVGGVRYVNCGDWVDSCTGIVEHMDGRLELIHWSQAQNNSDAAAAAIETAADDRPLPGRARALSPTS